MSDLNDLLAKIKQRAATEADNGYAASQPVVSPAAIGEAESVLGFELPELLKRLYLEVGNGGFGPYDGIIGLPSGWGVDEGDGYTLLELYQFYSQDLQPFPVWQWPAHLLPICKDDYGVICLDCATPGNPVIAFEATPFPEWSINLSFEAASFEEWFTNWLAKPNPNRK